jgi:predicted nucleic acid-binding protein
VARDVLLDTGPLVAHLDPRDQWHVRCAAAWPELVERCLTTEAVVAEACHLVLRGGGPAVLSLQFLLAAAIPIVGLETAGQRHAALLMERYADLPMDYADASLVALADALAAELVFTTDRRGFRTYRGARGSKFQVIPKA